MERRTRVAVKVTERVDIMAFDLDGSDSKTSPFRVPVGN
jgi:hypothetical protein